MTFDTIRNEINRLQSLVVEIEEAERKSSSRLLYRVVVVMVVARVAAGQVGEVLLETRLGVRVASHVLLLRMLQVLLLMVVLLDPRTDDAVRVPHGRLGALRPQIQRLLVLRKYRAARRIAAVAHPEKLVRHTCRMRFEIDPSGFRLPAQLLTFVVLLDHIQAGNGRRVGRRRMVGDLLELLRMMLAERRGRRHDAARLAGRRSVWRSGGRLLTRR